MQWLGLGLYDYIIEFMPDDAPGSLPLTQYTSR
jgi:hypothetical protein